MAVTVDAIMNQLETTVGAVTPTVDPALRFRAEAGTWATVEDESITSDFERTFQVRDLTGELVEGGYHHHLESERREFIAVFLVYADQGDYRALNRRLASDRADLVKAINDPANWLAGIIHQWVPSWELAEPPAPGQPWIQRLIVEVRFPEAA